MPRSKNSKNECYNYEVIKGDENKYIRTLHLVAEYLEVSPTSIVRKLRNPEVVLNKYKNTNLIINKVKIPIYERKEIEY